MPPTDNGTCPLASSGQPIDDATGLLHQIDATLSDVVWIYEPRSERFLYVNSAYEREWQRDARELYADSRQWLRAAHPDDRPLLRASFARLARGDGYDVEYRTTLGSGAQRWIAERALPVSVEAGQWPRFAGVSHDITRHKVEQLEQLRSSRAQNEFLAVLSHELRNPLQPIRSAVALLAQQPADNAAPARKAVSIIERQVDHIARLVDDLLDVSRIKFGKLRLHPEAIRIGDVIESAVAAHQMLIDAQRLCLRHTGPPGPVWVQGDTVRLTQVFCNLLHNAAKFSRAEGTIEIAVHPEDGSGNVAISVRDEGAGIAPALLDSVFDLYVQHDQSVAHDHGGLGIGLSVVRSLVELHGGRVAVRSDGPGRGSEFVVTLPGARDPTAAAAITRRIEPTRTSKRRVLLVDDSRDAAESMQALLEAEGHAVLLAFTGQSALEEAQRAQPDVVILDLDLPDIHGCEVARRLRSQAQSATALLFALTGSDGEQDRQAVLAAGFNQYFVKPANPATLLQALSA
ncbi:MAG TPA: ATP-binding protein [Ideonella sp.]|uniref:hybrid sensor histidine kinase/response regulator n=1 Tax=Ideonella sp. TaxID=1929293 RepID=UPI002E32A80B|nr:ATP-binding protein [Ideonella sp.]HEX5685881.1 ATP-binding protein [Ideonella sp.]